MKRLGSHPHIVSFIGCCKRDTICLLMDYCQLGDLRSFLLRYRRGLQVRTYHKGLFYIAKIRADNSCNSNIQKKGVAMVVVWCL